MTRNTVLEYLRRVFPKEAISVDEETWSHMYEKEEIKTTFKISVNIQEPAIVHLAEEETWEIALVSILTDAKKYQYVQLVEPGGSLLLTTPRTEELPQELSWDIEHPELSKKEEQLIDQQRAAAGGSDEELSPIEPGEQPW